MAALWTTMSDGPSDVWAAGDQYEPYVGRWGRLVAAEFLAWTDVPPGLEWLDVGCGTGVLTETVLQAAAPRRVIGVDLSAAFVEYARDHIQDSRAAFEVADARALPFAHIRFDAAVSGLALNFVPGAAAAEMERVTRPGGIVAAYVWDYAEGMQMMRCFWDAAVALNRSAAELDEARRFPICRPEPLKELWGTTGLRDIEVRAIEIRTRFRDFDDYWNPFLGGQGPAPSYAMSLEPERREELRELLHSKLSSSEDGSISLSARAWAVKGRKP
jgi:SAM-dependent methyltransferase